MPLGSLTGDNAQLGQLRRGLQKLGSGGYKATLSLVAPRVASLVDRGFLTATDPDGAPWAPTVKGNRPLAGPTGQLRAQAAKVRPFSGGVRVRISLDYAEFHMNGTSRMPPRPYLPSTDLGRLPSAWRTVVQAAMGTILQLYLPPPG